MGIRTILGTLKAQARRVDEFRNATPEQQRKLAKLDIDMANKKRRLMGRTHEERMLEHKKGPVKKKSLRKSIREAKERAQRKARERRIKVQSLREGGRV